MTKDNPPPQILKFTRAVRRQIYTADLVFAMSTCLDGNIPKKTVAVLKRIQVRVDNINKILYGGGRFVLTPRDWKKYNRVIEQLKKMIMNISADNKLEADFFNAVLMLIEDTRESVKKSANKELQREWTMLNRSMATFCKHLIKEPKHFDPNWVGYKYEALGVALGHKFESAMMV